MADEEQKPIGPGEEEPVPIDPATAPEPIKEMRAKTIREIRAETAPRSDLPEEARDLLDAEGPEQREAREEIEAALDKPIEAIEDAFATLDRVTTPRTPADVLPHPVSDTTDVLGRFTVPLPIYDVVFISLAIFTVIEVAVGTLLGIEWLAVILLLSIAVVKAFHVVWYYMHLSQDNRIFWLTLLMPFFIALVSAIYLLAVPPTGY